jgi:putative alpha-1,2-mannosidase
LNGKIFENSYITHKQILEGGILEFVMGAIPNKSWAAKKENCPQSILK